MWFTVRRTWDLTTNERMISFYKKELRSSHILEKAKKQKHYGTKRYRKFVAYDFLVQKIQKNKSYCFKCI